MDRRMIVMLLALLLCITLIPTSAFAQNGGPSTLSTIDAQAIYQEMAQLRAELAQVKQQLAAVKASQPVPPVTNAPAPVTQLGMGLTPSRILMPNPQNYWL